VVENIGDSCGLTLIVKDKEAKKRLQDKLYYVKMNKASLDNFLDTILTENDLKYTIEGDKLKISYLETKTFNLGYIAGNRTGKSNAHVTIANASGKSGSSSSSGGSGSSGDSSGNADSRTGVSIESSDEFKFWSKIKSEIKQMMYTAEDSYRPDKSSTSMSDKDSNTSKSEGGDGSPIINPEAGLITVTGTPKQIKRVTKYIESLNRKLKNQVMIDVKILSVTFDDSSTTGIDWSQLYSLQNMTLNSVMSATNNVSDMVYSTANGITEFTRGTAIPSFGAQALIASGHVEVNDIVKFLGTQGDVKSISNPKVMTLNNQPALISVGNELFYKIQSSSIVPTSGTSGSVATQGETIDSVFAGILLDITPEISDNGVITLKINPSISDTIQSVTSGSTARTIPPDLSRKQISSVVSVKDGQHIILGGLISSKVGTKMSKVPLLGDLPLFEHLFKHEVRLNQVDELVLIVTPHIIKAQSDVSLEDLGYKKLTNE
jgi:general secretion pathway protein D